MDENNVGMTQVGFRGSFMRGFQDFCCKTSLHGWVFLGEANSSVSQKIFWVFVVIISCGASVYLLQDTVDNFMSYKTKINIEDRSADLQDTRFPSVVVCNINPMRKSFIYWLQDNLQKDGKNVSLHEVFTLIGRQYFKTNKNRL